MILCDTNIFINYFLGDKLTKNILENDILLKNIVLSDIVMMELLRGCRNKQEVIQLKKFIYNKLSLVHSNEDSVKMALGWIEAFHLSHGLSIPDALIAGVAYAHDLPLFTYNTKDFIFLPEISLFTPPQPI